MLDLLFGKPTKRATLDADGFQSVGLMSWFSSWLAKTGSGVNVNEDIALTYSAVWCATRVISETAASLPLFLYQKTANDGREQATNHPLYPLLKNAPNPEMGSMAFREGRTAHQVNWGNAFAEIEWDSFIPRQRTKVLALHPIHPTRVKPVMPQTEDYREGYRYYVLNNHVTAPTRMKADEMLHVPGVLSEDGIWGKGVIQHAREAIGFGLATENHGATYFGTGGMPRGIVFSSGMKDKETRQTFRKEWKEIHGTSEADNIAILPLESKFQELAITNENAQFLETRRFNVSEIARWYRVPPHTLMDLTDAHHTNVEHMGLEFVIYSLFPWLRRWEEEINRKLLLPHEQGKYYAEHQLNALLRGDMMTRFQAYQTALMYGFLTINEVRRFENLNPIGEAGDLHFFPHNMTSVSLMLAASKPKPEAIPGAQGGGADVQATALNGAQIASLVLVADKLAQGECPPEGTRAMIQGAFPLMDTALIDTIVDELNKVKEEAQNEPQEPDDMNPVEPIEPTEPVTEPVPMEDAATEALATAIRRTLVKEAVAAKRQAKSRLFPDWLADFHLTHHRLVLKEVAPTVALLQLMGCELSAKRVADHVISASRTDLLAAHAEDQPNQFAKRFETWSSRALSLARELLGDFAPAPSVKATKRTIVRDENNLIAEIIEETHE